MRSRRVNSLLAGVATIAVAVALGPNRVAAEGASDQLQEAIRLFNQGDYAQARHVLLRLEVEDLSDVERAERNRVITEASVAQNQSVKAQREKTEADRAFEEGHFDQAQRLYQAVLDNRYAQADLREEAAERLKRIAGEHPLPASGGGASNSQQRAEPAGRSEDRIVAERAENDPHRPATGEPLVQVAVSSDRREVPERVSVNPELEEPVGPVVPDELLAELEGQPAEPPAQELPGQGASRSVERKVAQDAAGDDSVRQAFNELERIIPQAELAAEVVVEPRSEKTTTQPGTARTPSEPSQDLRAQAGQEVQAGRAALDKGDLAAATEHFRRALELVPGLPEATEGLETVEQFQRIEEPASLVDKIRQRKAIQWQKTDTIFRQADRDIRRAVEEHRYDEARKALEYARQTIESNRANAEPASLYEDLKRELEALARFIDEDQRKYEELQVKEAMEEVARAQKIRQEEAERAKQQKIDHLMNQAMELRKEKRFAEAIEALNQVILIDSRQERAKWLKEDLEAVMDYRHQREVEDERKRQVARAMMEVRDDMIPWSRELMRFPKDWREITVRRQRITEAEARKAEIDRELLEKLERTIPEIKFDQAPFGQVIDLLRDQEGLNIDVRWKVLSGIDIDRETPVTLDKLTNVRLDALLEAVLDSVASEPGQIAYGIDLGKITISTKEDLQRKVTAKAVTSKLIQRRYDVRELLHDTSGGGMMGGMGGYLSLIHI